MHDARFVSLVHRRINHEKFIEVFFSKKIPIMQLFAL